MAAPPFGYKGAPDGEVPVLPPVAVVREPVMSISYPFGCGGDAILTLDTMPVMDREPMALPDIPGGGWSYTQFLEYVDLGITPYNDGLYTDLWSGPGAYSWAVYIDGVDSLVRVAHYDGTPGPIAVLIPVGSYDWTVTHTWQLLATYVDRPAYSEYWLDAGVAGVVSFGPSTDPTDPNFPYSRGGVDFGCCQRDPAFFPSVDWSDLGYWEKWVNAHHNVASLTGPSDRHGASLGLTGPWGTAVPQQYLSSYPGAVNCGGGPCRSGAVPSTGGAGDVWAVSLLDLFDVVTYARHEYTVASNIQSLAPCAPSTTNPVFDETRAFKAAT